MHSRSSTGGFAHRNVAGNGRRSLVKTALKHVKTLANFATSDTGVAIRNLLPDADETGRPAFAGEKHMILKLKNGKNGIANYMGPGTAVIKRAKRGDPGRTPSDTVAKRHDIDFTLAANSKTKKEQLVKTREADNRMIDSMQKIKTNRADAPRNIAAGLRLIQAKVKAENAGVLSKSKFTGDLEPLSPEDEAVLERAKQDLPGGALKKQLIRRQKRARMKGGDMVLKNAGDGQSRSTTLDGMADHKINPKKTKGNKQVGGFIFTLAAIIAAASAAASAAMATGIPAAIATGAATAAGALIVEKIAGNGLIGDSIKKVIRGVDVGIRDLSPEGKIALKNAFADLKASPTKDTVSKVGKSLAPHFQKAVVKIVKNKLGVSGKGLSLVGTGNFKKEFVTVFEKKIVKP